MAAAVAAAEALKNKINLLKMADLASGGGGVGENNQMAGGERDKMRPVQLLYKLKLTSHLFVTMQCNTLSVSLTFTHQRQTPLSFRIPKYDHHTQSILHSGESRAHVSLP